MIQVFCEQIIQNNKHVFLTTHNPLVLDGLDLQNDDIRLFAVDRDSNGYAQIRRISVSQELIDEGSFLYPGSGSAEDWEVFHHCYEKYRDYL